MTTHPSPVAAVATAGTSEAPSSVASRASGPAADATPGRISSAMAALHRDIRKRIVSSSSQSSPPAGLRGRPVPIAPASRRILARSAAIALGIGLAGSLPVAAATHTVAALNYRFGPASLTVGVGDTVRWTFAGEPHSVTSGTPPLPDGKFDSGIIGLHEPRPP